MDIKIKKYDFEKMTYQEMIEAYHLVEKDLLELRLIGFKERIANYSFLKKNLKKNRSRLLQKITFEIKKNAIFSLFNKAKEDLNEN